MTPNWLSTCLSPVILYAFISGILYLCSLIEAKGRGKDSDSQSVASSTSTERLVRVAGVYGVALTATLLSTPVLSTSITFSWKEMHLEAALTTITYMSTLLYLIFGAAGQSSRTHLLVWRMLSVVMAYVILIMVTYGKAMAPEILQEETKEWLNRNVRFVEVIWPPANQEYKRSRRITKAIMWYANLTCWDPTSFLQIIGMLVKLVSTPCVEKCTILDIATVPGEWEHRAILYLGLVAIAGQGWELISQLGLVYDAVKDRMAVAQSVQTHDRTDSALPDENPPTAENVEPPYQHS